MLVRYLFSFGGGAGYTLRLSYYVLEKDIQNNYANNVSYKYTFGKSFQVFSLHAINMFVK